MYACRVSIMITTVSTILIPNPYRSTNTRTHAAMAVGLDKLERRLERLEKFFSKKRRGSSRVSLASDGTPASPLSLSAMSDSIFRTFPQPSFIRPTSTRMFAREEVSLALRPEQRSHSLPETLGTPRLMSLTSTLEAESMLGSSASQPPRIPKRSSSLSPTRRPASLASLGELLEFSFASPPRKRAANKSPSESRPRSGSISPKAQPNRRRQPDELHDVHLIRHHQHPVTPPPSAEYDKTFASTKLGYRQNISAATAAGELTPEPSPKFVPLLGYETDSSEMDSSAKRQRPKSLYVATSLFREAKAALRRPVSCSSLGAPKSAFKGDHSSKEPTSVSGRPEHPTRSVRPITASKEPSFSDFLSLSDDDIAGDALAPLARLPLSSKPPSCALPPDPPGLVLSPQVPAGARLLTLSPPLASRPATAAAFEAARIAARYKFDLVYVVNLWPSRIGSVQTSLGPEERSPSRSTADGNMDRASHLNCHSPRVEMTGRLLAAYGLPFIKSPFRISESVHLKVLRSEGWLEYRCENVTSEEFSRGYSCSFYTGHSLGGRSKSIGKDGSSKERRGTPNRGVVFAAYRLPRADGQDLQSDDTELAALRTDAETLVDMLIDIHMTQRQRRPLGCIKAGAGPPPSTIGTPLSA